ncbi:hypothetical protein G6514_005985 [Epicoccum nigrum]|nr:hypothetical protein G6514_005985 [Epicoccum nigrum]
MPHSAHSSSPSPSQDSQEEGFASLPPFPSTVPTAPLFRISLAKLTSQDEAEQERCWQACRELGFFYLDLRGCTPGCALLSDADALFELMRVFYALPVGEKVKYDFKKEGSYFGYKGYGEGIVDASGGRDRNEFYNVSKDDILGVSERLPAPACLSGRKERALCKAFIEESHAVCSTVMELLSTRLPLREEARNQGALGPLHRLQAPSGDQIRFVRAPPQEKRSQGVALGEHTDFGSVTLLFNRLGGLQVRLPPGMDPVAPATDGMSETEQTLCQDGWCYVRPLRGHAIVNLGDALVKFSNGRVRSNVHRVVAPPGRQGEEERWSLVYFCRPGDEVVLRSLVGDGDAAGGEEGEGVTAKEWILRRALGRREKSGWEKSGGTEEGSMRAGGMRG